MYPEDMLTLQLLGDTYLLQNKYEESIALFEKVFRLYKDWIQMVFGTAGHAHGKVGNHEKARSILNEALETRKTSNFSPLIIALIYKGLGNTDKTFEWLEKAYEERDHYLIYIKEGYPQFWDLHDDPRFQALLKKMGFEE
jgi:tetratricopeptide (TPR) repeat protein